MLKLINAENESDTSRILLSNFFRPFSESLIGNHISCAQQSVTTRRSSAGCRRNGEDVNAIAGAYLEIQLLISLTGDHTAASGLALSF